MLREYFAQYLKASRNVSDVTISKYISAMGIITQILHNNGFPVNDIFEVDTVDELESLKDFIFCNKEFLIKDETGNRMYSVAFNHFYKFACQGEIGTKKEIEKLDIVLPPNKKLATTQSRKWPRNQILVFQVIQSANYCCEYNVEHKTFTAKATNANYVEGHHLIPMEKQDKFDVSLDVYANIVSLCPICHRLLHHGVKDEKIYVLEKIYNERCGRLLNSGIDVSVKDLIEITA